MYVYTYVEEGCLYVHTYVHTYVHIYFCTKLSPYQQMVVWFAWVPTQTAANNKTQYMYEWMKKKQKQKQKRI